MRAPPLTDVSPYYEALLDLYLATYNSAAAAIRSPCDAPAKIPKGGCLVRRICRAISTAETTEIEADLQLRWDAFLEVSYGPRAWTSHDCMQIARVAELLFRALYANAKPTRRTARVCVLSVLRFVAQGNGAHAAVGLAAQPRQHTVDSVFAATDTVTRQDVLRAQSLLLELFTRLDVA
jgi:hypothetical protein